MRTLFADGRTVSIREFIVGGFKDEMGLQSPDPVLCGATDPNDPVRTETIAGMAFDPATDRFEWPPVYSPGDDTDRDGVV